MTDAELSELERLAKEATPGPWPQGKEDKEFVLYNGTFICGCNSAIMRNGDVIDGKTNARYIAAANPAAILELIAELRQARKDACEWINIARWLIRKFGRETVETEMIMMARHALGYENTWKKA